MCTSIRFTDNSGHMYLGRNLDWSFDYGQQVRVMPRGFHIPYSFIDDATAAHAVIGMCIDYKNYPMFFDCGNDAGLAVAGLNFPGYAEYADDQIKTIVAIISYIWKVREPMLPAENAILRKSVIGFYDYVNNSSIGEKHERIFPTLITYRAYLKEVFSKRMTEFEKQKFEIEELLLLLEPYTDGELSFLLNATENVDIVHDRLIAFDMEDASKKEYFPLVAIITLQMIVDKIKKRQGFAKELIIDEALDFLQDEKFGDFIAYLYRTFRKKEGSITLAAQNILFLKNMPSSIKDSIIINCATKIILDHSEHRQNLPEVKAVLSITDEEAYMIESLQRTERWREFFIKMSNDAFIFRNEVSDFAAVAFDSRQATVVRLKQLFNESGSTYTAINRYLEERRKKYG